MYLSKNEPELSFGEALIRRGRRNKIMSGSIGTSKFFGPATKSNTMKPQELVCRHCNTSDPLGSSQIVIERIGPYRSMPISYLASISKSVGKLSLLTKHPKAMAHLKATGTAIGIIAAAIAVPLAIGYVFTHLPGESLVLAWIHGITLLVYGFLVIGLISYGAWTLYNSLYELFEKKK